MSPTHFRLAIAASGVIAFLWSLPGVHGEGGSKSTARSHDLPRLAHGVIPSRSIQ